MLIKDSKFKPSPRRVQHNSYPAISVMYQAQLSIPLSVVADQWEDVRITTEMLLWGSPVHKKEEKIARKNTLKSASKALTHFKTCLKVLMLL